MVPRSPKVSRINCAKFKILRFDLLQFDMSDFAGCRASNVTGNLLERCPERKLQGVMIYSDESRTKEKGSIDPWAL